MKKVIVFGLLILLSTSLRAQEKSPADTTAAQTIDGIVNEVLKIMAGEKGKVRNWSAFRDLFLPTATFTVLNHDDTFPTPTETVSLEEFIELMHDSYYDEGYIEYELGKVVNEYNGIANVFQSVYHKDSENVEGKGMNSYQLIYFKNRWWIANLIWTTDSNGVEVPKEYLEK